MIYNNASLDKVQSETLARLHAEGYDAVKTSHIALFKDIYDFICRFADADYEGCTISMSSGDIPKETYRIVNTIGFGRLYLYFSSHQYPKRFYQFCKKLIQARRISSCDYLADGTIVATKIKYEETQYD